MLQNNDRVKVVDNRFRHKPELSRIGQFGTVLDAPAFALQALVQLDSGEIEYFWPSELERCKMFKVNDRFQVVHDDIQSNLLGFKGRVIGVNPECEDGLEVFVELDVVTTFGRKFWFNVTELEIIGESDVQ